jgi:hypothetical protein
MKKADSGEFWKPEVVVVQKTVTLEKIVTLLDYAADYLFDEFGTRKKVNRQRVNADFFSVTTESHRFSLDR